MWLVISSCSIAFPFIYFIASEEHTLKQHEKVNKTRLCNLYPKQMSWQKFFHVQVLRELLAYSETGVA